MNPRAASHDLLPFQGSPFGQLGYFSLVEKMDAVPTQAAFRLIGDSPILTRLTAMGLVVQ